MEPSRGRLGPDETKELLETIVFQQLAETCVQKGGSRLAQVGQGSWQANLLRKCANAVQAENAEQLRAAMGSPSDAVIFLPHQARVTLPIIERICNENALNKFIVWETN